MSSTEISIDQLVALPREKRIEIIEALWGSFDGDDPYPISDEFADELERRCQEHLADPSSSEPWEQVEEELWSRVRGRRPE